MENKLNGETDSHSDYISDLTFKGMINLCSVGLSVVKGFITSGPVLVNNSIVSRK